jgi:hypothetical protein
MSEEENEWIITQEDLEEFVHERREVLIQMNRKAIEAWAAKWQIICPEKDYPFWKGVHMARFSLKGIPFKERIKSEKWLNENVGRIRNVESGISTG